MTTKMQQFIAQLAAGQDVEAAAVDVGYGLTYARKISLTPELQEAVRRRRAYMATIHEVADSVPKTPMQVLEAIVYDPLMDPRVRISAARAIAALAEDEIPGAEPVTIIDDVRCDGCQKQEKSSWGAD